MNIRSKAIYLTAAGIIGYGIVQQGLGFWDMLGIFVSARLLVMVFEDEKPDAEKPKEAKIEKPKEVLAIPAGHHLITTAAVKEYRNLFLRHHNMKQTDADYIASAMAKETVAIVASLNVFLKGKR